MSATGHGDRFPAPADGCAFQRCRPSRAPFLPRTTGCSRRRYPSRRGSGKPRSWHDPLRLFTSHGHLPACCILVCKTLTFVKHLHRASRNAQRFKLFFAKLNLACKKAKVTIIWRVTRQSRRRSIATAPFRVRSSGWSSSRTRRSESMRWRVSSASAARLCARLCRG
ncbi:hypothetical protein EMEDMD4_1080022 [Sinorhizobium medicae]|uniref:Uncharacterized protein n=1 Tax=Sinorhizobium medicae TaxID=110321 RepID=A0A508WPU2_9HYPH|nr:hypothetical protein EMEDMD4_1080022 [Sinorhizobium medicae]